MKSVLKWIAVGLLATAVLAAFIFLTPDGTPIEERADIQMQKSFDVQLDLPSMPQMSVRDDAAQGQAVALGPDLEEEAALALQQEAFKQENQQEEPQEEKQSLPVEPAQPSAETEEPSELPYPMEEDIPPPPSEDEVKEKDPPPQPKASLDKRPKIAIIIDDMGLNRRLSDRAVRLSKEITLAYLPYAPNLKDQANSAAAMGHDVVLHFPMEPKGSQNPGPGALLTTQTAEEWEALIEKNLNTYDHFVGVNNHMGSKFSTDGRGLAFVAHALSERGLFFVDSRTISDSVAAKVMRIMKVKTASRDVFLDHIVKKAEIRKELARAEAIARRKGQVIIIGHPHPQTLAVLEEWAVKPSFNDFNLVPVRELVK